MVNNANLFAHFKQHFPENATTELLKLPEGVSISYRDAENASAKIANTLLQFGALPGDRVTVQVEKSAENLFLYLACLRAGLVYHPLNPAYKASELTYFLGDAEPAIVVCDSAMSATVESALPKHGVKALLTLGTDGSGTLIDESEKASRDAPIERRDDSDTAALLYSSGTTGKPKGIMLSHKNLRSNATTLVDVWGFSPSDRLLHMLPIYHAHGLFVGVGCVLMSGSSMLWHSRFSANEAIKALPHCTVMMGVPTYYTRLLANPAFNVQCCSKMRLFISGSAPLLAETFAEFQQRSGHTILERYGMTETVMNTSNPLHGVRRAGSVGPPLPDVTIRVVDDEGHELSAGEPGNLQLKGPNVFSGYWKMPDKTTQDFTADGFFNTGDKAVIDADGYISIIGRTKDMIISGGLNIYPKEIELVIDAMPGVYESAVIGVPDADFGEAVVAIVVAKDSPGSVEDIIAHCRTELAHFKVPKRIHFVSELPRNAMGKVQKNVLREQVIVATEASQDPRL